jgi:eukaryotic-like serine/threonine-protein kinase
MRVAGQDAEPTPGEGSARMQARKLNCWEHRKCGRGPGGSRISELGICPAARDTSFHGINGGVNAGRICWAVAGTFCDSKVQGSFAEKRESCLGCAFFDHVRHQEGTENKTRKFLAYVSRKGTSPIFRSETYKYIRAGKRFIRQGEVGDTAYIIQSGSCLVIVEKDGELFPVDHYGEGDIVGGMGILTGEPHRAHVEAETDMEVWALTREDFDRISARDPDLLTFLTEFVANRLDSRRPTAYRTIGKYVATDIIGRGGYSVVYKGVHSALNMPVAIKMLRHNLALNPDFLHGFLQEAKTIAGLHHENIIRIYDIEQRFKTVFIIMELLTGESLLDLLARLKVLSIGLATNILLQVCHALDYAHRQGIIHRDVTADNIFLLPGNRVKVMDFGLACPVGTEDINLTGTAAYISPEQIEGEPVDARTDIYGLGVVAYEMVTGQKPFQGKDAHAVLDAHLTRDIPDPADIVTNLPEELRAFILKAGRRNPAERHQSVGQVLDALHPLARGLNLAGKHLLPAERKLTNLILLYGEEHQQRLSLLMEEFCAKARDLGVVLKISDVHTL